MNILVDKGRNLSAGNFSKELVFAFNAPPIHILSESFIPEVVDTLVGDKQMLFFRKGDSTNQAKMKLKSLSASLGNYRQKANNNSHLPLCFFPLNYIQELISWQFYLLNLFCHNV